MFLYVVPNPPLSKHVRLLWYHEDYTSTSPRERLLPTGTVEIVFDLSGAPSRIFRDEDDVTGTENRSVICGPQSRYFVLDTSKPQTVAGIHFAPGGAAPFFQLPVSEMRDQHIALDDVWGRAAAASILEQMHAAPSPKEKLAVLENALLRQAGRPIGEPRHRSVDYALRRFTAIPHLETVACVADQLSLTPRRFIQLFSEETGFTPKLYCRIMRFQAAIRQAGAGSDINWSAVAADCGYFDQAHFIHDFKSFAGLRPTDYAPIRGPHLNHVPLS
jgi:AraC-like DNA-binding protein